MSVREPADDDVSARDGEASGLVGSAWENGRDGGRSSVTAESDDQDAGTAEPGNDSAQETTDSTPVLDLDTLDNLTDDEAAEVGAAAARALAITEGSRERLVSRVVSH